MGLRSMFGGCSLCVAAHEPYMNFSTLSKMAVVLEPLVVARSKMATMSSQIMLWTSVRMSASLIIPPLRNDRSGNAARSSFRGSPSRYLNMSSINTTVGLRFSAVRRRVDQGAGAGAVVEEHVDDHLQKDDVLHVLEP